MRKLTYNITEKNGAKTIRTEVNGYYAFELFGLDFGVHKDGWGWVITELSTGSKINAFGDTRKETIKLAKEYLTRAGKEATQKAVEHSLKRLMELVEVKA